MVRNRQDSPKPSPGWNAVPPGTRAGGSPAPAAPAARGNARRRGRHRARRAHELGRYIGAIGTIAVVALLGLFGTVVALDRTFSVPIPPREATRHSWRMALSVALYNFTGFGILIRHFSHDLPTATCAGGVDEIASSA